MDEQTAELTFFPWIARGLALEIDPCDQSNLKLNGDRATVTVNITGSRTIGTKSPDLAPQTVSVSLHGPSDIIGFDTQSIIRVYPKPDTQNFEHEYFPHLEFDQPDLPWRHSPFGSEKNANFRYPWLYLLALEDSEFSEGDPASAKQPFPAINLNGSAPLPALTQSWAWAHSQSSSTSTGRLDTKLKGDPNHFRSRLISPRRLIHNTTYTVFLVPAFQLGVIAGLGGKTGTDPGYPATTANKPFAWDNAKDTGYRPKKLPYYFRWKFHTSAGGDFEVLALALKPVQLDETIGAREIDVSAPIGNLPITTPPVLSSAAKSGKMRLEGALLSTTALAKRTAWPDLSDTLCKNFIHAIQGILNPSNTIKLAPPVYGKWQCGRDQLGFTTPTTPTSTPHWLQELNQDPRWRVAAGLGARVVEADRDALLASAWKQVAGIRPTNQKVYFFQATLALAASLHKRHVSRLNDDSRLHVTLPGIGGAGQLSDTGKTRKFRTGLLDPQWRKLTKPASPVGRLPAAGNLVSQVINQTPPNSLPKLFVALPPKTPATLVTPATSVTPTSVLGGGIAGLKTTLKDVQTCTFPKPVYTLDLVTVNTRAPLTYLISRRAPAEEGRAEGRAVREPSETDFDKLSAAAEAKLRKVYKKRGETNLFFTAITDMIDEIGDIGASPPDTSKDATTTDVANTLVGMVHPQTTIARTVNLEFTGSPRPAEMGSMKDVRAINPTFPHPMSKPLFELSREWLLPGLENVPPNSYSLLITNQKFIEAYMIGLNDEMSRKLLWDEYPTDERGTYFQQFWDVSCFYATDPNLPPPTAQNLRDIPAIDGWSTDAALGEKGGAQVNADHVVIMVRGELLHRYPNTIAYMAAAVLWKTDSNGVKHYRPSSIEKDHRHPIFSGTLGSDTYYFGFPLSKDVVSIEGSWMFVLQEHAHEARFGVGAKMAEPKNDKEQWIDLTTSGNLFTNQMTSGVIAQNAFITPMRVAINAWEVAKQI